VPTYLIEGKKVKAEKPLTEAEIDEIAASVRAPAASQTAPQAPVSEVPAPRRGFFERFAGVGPGVGLVDVTTPSRLTPEQLQESAREQVAIGAGLAAGPVLAAGTRLAGAAVPALQRVATPLATAFETGGFQTGLGKEAPRAARLATRVIGGAVPGAIGGAVTGEPGAGAAIGAGAAVLAPAVASIVSKGAGSVIDALAGRTADVRANRLIRLAANDEVNALRQAMAAQPDVPASRAAANMNLPLLQALLQRAEQRDPQLVVNAFRQRESQDIVNELTRIAGGPTAETARAAREGAKDTLTAVTKPMREQELAAAAATGKIVPKLQTIAADARKGVTEAVERVRRYSGAINSAQEWAKNWVRQSRLVEGADGKFTREYVRGIGEAGVRPPTGVTYPGLVAQAADRRAAEAAEESLRLGRKARGAEARLAAMEAEGLKPITLNQFTAPIDRLMADPEVATNATLQKALPQVRQMFEDWANEFGVISPDAVYAIRKNGVNSVVQQLMPAADAKAQSRMAAQVLTKLRPAIDDAIEQAGGRNWRAYLDSFDQGMSSIKGMELADQIRKLYAQGTPASKQQIIDLVRGESPDVVEDLFGSGRYKISEEMAKDMPLLRRIADTVDLDMKAVQQAAAGRAALTEVEKKGRFSIRWPFFSRASTAVNEVTAKLEEKIKGETLDVLIRAAQSGREFNRVLDVIPAKERSAFLAQFKNAESWSKFSTEVANATRSYAVAQTGEPNINALVRPQP